MNTRYIILTSGPDEWRLQWALEDVDASHEVAIDRASSPEGPWSLAGTVDYSTVSFTDHVPPNRGHFTQMFYRLRVYVLTSPDVDVYVSEPVSSAKAGTKITAEIIRQHELLLKGVNGHPGYFSRYFACFKHTKNGTECPQCVDELTGERGLVAHCDICKGTGYIEGYANPILFRGTWRDSEMRSQMSMITGPREDVHRTLWTAAYPVFEPGDVVVEKDGRSYEVTGIQVSEPGGYIVSQTLTVASIDPQYIAATLSYPA